MVYAILTPRELTVVFKRGVPVGLFTQPYLVARYLLQSDAADGAHLSAEVLAQQFLTQPDALENLCTTVRTDGRYAHLRHDFFQPLVYGLDVVGLGSGVFLLHLASLHQVVQHGKHHVRTQCRRTVAQQQGGMHGLAHLAALHDERRLHALAYSYQIVVNSRDGEEGRDKERPNQTLPRPLPVREGSR